MFLPLNYSWTNRVDNKINIIDKTQFYQKSQGNSYKKTPTDELFLDMGSKRI